MVSHKPLKLSSLFVIFFFFSLCCSYWKNSTILSSSLLVFFVVVFVVFLLLDLVFSWSPLLHFPVQLLNSFALWLSFWCFLTFSISFLNFSLYSCFLSSLMSISMSIILNSLSDKLLIPISLRIFKNSILFFPLKPTPRFPHFAFLSVFLCIGQNGEPLLGLKARPYVSCEPYCSALP